MTGKDLAEEDAAFLKYLAANGWEGSVGEDDEAEMIGKTSQSSLRESEEALDEKI